MKATNLQMKPSTITPDVVSNLQGSVIDLPNQQTLVVYDDQCAGEFITDEERRDVSRMLSADSKLLIAAGIRHRISGGSGNAIPCIELL